MYPELALFQLQVANGNSLPYWIAWAVDPSFWGLVVSGLLSVAVAVFVERYFERRKEQRETKSLAFILELEIETIKRLAKLNLEINRSIVQKARETHASSDFTKGSHGILIVDADLPISSFERMDVNLGLFDEKTVSSVAELYRIVDIVHYNKRLNQSYYEQGQKITETLAGAAPNEAQKARAFLFYGNAILFAESYISTLEVVIKLCDEALQNLGRYRKFDPEEFKIEIGNETRIQGHERDVTTISST